MNAQELKEALSISDIITYVTVGLGSDGYTEDSSGNPIFQTIDHNSRGQGKYKLYYYDDRKLFVSYTGDGSMDIFELTIRAGMASDFKSAFNYVADFFGYNPWIDDRTEKPQVELTADWDILTRFDAIDKPKEKQQPLKSISSSLVEYFPNLQPEVWHKEGISVPTMRKYGIRMDTINEKIVIPHYDISGRLVGLRGRAFNWLDLQKGAKYAPLHLGEGKFFTMYNHPLGENLYGLYQNQNAIRATRQCIMFESEKSVLLVQDYWGEGNVSVAVCGSNITDTQVNLLLDLGVTDVTIAFDKENPTDLMGAPDTVEYKNKLLKLASLFSSFVNTYYILDTFGKLNYKDSPADRGKETFEFLLQNRIFVPTSNSLAPVRGYKK